jgi:(1->4)-alpha-D-glucan 1-alpha-D-glucosylmutase
MSERQRAPVSVRSTYRVQVRPDFGLAQTADLVPYLAALGATHLYSAPLLHATPGSAHGYDVVDPTEVNPDLGGAQALDGLVGVLRAHGLGLVVDIVPNHLGVRVPEANPAWWSVLRDGSASPFAAWFDIDWDRGPLLIPVFADDAAVNELKLADGELRYFEHRYPIAPGTAGGSATEVHQRQHYRLVAWRRGNAELTYRRFFAVSDLAAVRVEDPAVFAATHAEVLRWVDAGLVDGIRVDHPDGLRDPGEYLRRLRAAAPSSWLLVEKILEYAEQLPADWPVDGTTGYDALRDVCGVFVDPADARGFPTSSAFVDVASAAKREAATGLLATELTRLTRLVPLIPGAREALAEIATHLSVYRTYLPDGRELLADALSAARAQFPQAVDALVPVLADPGGELSVRFEQYTGAVMAKGVEDTAYYRWTRFVALNEVGGAPDHFGVSPEEFHVAAMSRQRDWPLGMTTLSTHDTKRSEDVRARLAVLAEVADEWHHALASFTAAAPFDDPDMATLMWQSAIGAWPIERERLHAYVEKAAREAATRTTWDEPDGAYEQAMHAVVDAMYDDATLRRGLDEFVAAATGPGWSNALGQKLVQLTMPGVPDTYQGLELWDNSLVDPDNRRPVDFAHRAALLAQIDSGALPPIDATGAVKLLVTSRALRARRDRPELFDGYRPLTVRGPHAAHVFGFDRGGAITVVTRLPVTLARGGGWQADDVLSVPAGSWRDALTGASVVGPDVVVRDLLTAYPVALLLRSDS